MTLYTAACYTCDLSSLDILASLITTEIMLPQNSILNPYLFLLKFFLAIPFVNNSHDFNYIASWSVMPEFE